MENTTVLPLLILVWQTDPVIHDKTIGHADQGFVVETAAAEPTSNLELPSATISSSSQTSVLEWRQPCRCSITLSRRRIFSLIGSHSIQPGRTRFGILCISCCRNAISHWSRFI